MAFAALIASRGSAEPAGRRLAAGRPALAVAVLFGISSAFALATSAATLAWDPESFSSSSEAELVTLTNQSRVNAGLRTLPVDSTLASVARWRSKDMIERDYFSHSIPGYGKVWDKLQAVGYCYLGAAENIGWNDYPDDIATAFVHESFMASAGHRANILGETWDAIGIGAYKGPAGKKMWTVLFADECGATATPKPTVKATLTPTPKPTATPTPKPTATPTPKPTATPAPRTTPASTPKATPRPTLKPTILATPAPTRTAMPRAPRATLRPAPRPTPQPVARAVATPAPTLAVTPMTAPTQTPRPTLTPPVDADLAGGPWFEPLPDPTPSPGPDDALGGTGPVRLRVVEVRTPPGLLETIIGGVTGFFFGG